MQFESWNFKFVGIIFYKLTSVYSTVFTLFPWQGVDSSCHGGLSRNTPFVLSCGTEGIRVVRQQRKFWCWVMAWGHEGRWEPKGKPRRESDYKPRNWVAPLQHWQGLDKGEKWKEKKSEKDYVWEQADVFRNWIWQNWLERDRESWMLRRGIGENAVRLLEKCVSAQVFFVLIHQGKSDWHH